MSRYQLQITATSAVSPAANRERGFLTPCLPYLPGGALRGALAAYWMAHNGQPDDRFTAQVGALRIGPAVPVGASARPLSVYSCKYPKGPACQQVHDAAFDELPLTGTCPGCGAKLEGSKGQWESGAAIGSRTRTALGPDGTVLEGSLFTRQFMARGQRFTATAEGDLDWLGADPVELRVGGQRSLAGAVTLQAQPTQPPAASGGARLVIRLAAPAVFLSADARNQLQPTPADLSRALRGTDMAGAKVRVSGAWTRPDTVGGWNAAAGLPKATEVAAGMASTYQLECPDGFSDAAAAAIRDRGLGVRRADGWGWVDVASGPWRPTGAATEAVARAAPDPELARIAAQIAKLGGGADTLRRRITGWLREGYTAQNRPPGSAYDGQTSPAKLAADDALAVTGERRRALVVVLAAADYAAGGSNG